MPSEMTVSLTPTSEYGALENFLDAQRVGLIRKVEGVSDALARQAPTASSLSLLGLIKHAVTWEQRWFHMIEETACPGHADIIRESLDGSRGI